MFCKVCSFSLKKSSIRQSEAFEKKTHSNNIESLVFQYIKYFSSFQIPFLLKSRKIYCGLPLNIVLHLILYVYYI